jgi:hypothetical protein
LAKGQGCGSCPHVGSPDSDPPNRLIYIYDEIGSTSPKLAFDAMRSSMTSSELVIEDLIEDLLSVGMGYAELLRSPKIQKTSLKIQTSLVWMKRE